MTYSVFLAGIGRIGATYDIDCKEDQKEPRSHLGAVQAHPAFQVKHIVDTNKDAFETVGEHWGLAPDIFSRDVSNVSGSFDVCVFATPPDHRLAELEFALKHDARAIVFEKPLSSGYAQAQAMLDLLGNYNSKPQIIVNFTRRFDAKYQKLKASFGAPPDRVVCSYSKGLENYASHHIDLVQHWFGEILSVQAFGDLDAKNPCFSCEMAGGIQADFLGLDDRDYDIFDMQLWFKDKRVDLMNGGVEVREYLPQADLYYKNYAHLVEKNDLSMKGIVLGMEGLYRELEMFLSGDRKQDNEGSSLEDAVCVMKVIEAVKQSSRNKGEIIQIKEMKT